MLLVIAAALIGGLAAAELVHASRIVAVIVAVVAALITVAVFRSSGRPAEMPFADRDGLTRANGPGTSTMGPGNSSIPAATIASPAPLIPSAPSAPSAPLAGPGRGQHETAVQLLPLPPPGDSNARPAGQGNQSWWDAAQGAPPPPSAGAKRAPAPDLSTYLASTFIAQCPRCGAFRLDIARARDGLDFRCEACEFIWTWQPGTPWPPVRVMPGRRRGSRPPSP